LKVARDPQLLSSSTNQPEGNVRMEINSIWNTFGNQRHRENRLKTMKNKTPSHLDLPFACIRQQKDEETP
jgi:hypothetical protein